MFAKAWKNTINRARKQSLMLKCMKIVTAGTSHVRIQERDDKKNKMQKAMQEAM